MSRCKFIDHASPGQILTAQLSGLKKHSGSSVGRRGVSVESFLALLVQIFFDQLFKMCGARRSQRRNKVAGIINVSQRLHEVDDRR